MPCRIDHYRIQYIVWLRFHCILYTMVVPHFLVSSECCLQILFPPASNRSRVRQLRLNTEIAKAFVFNAFLAHFSQTLTFVTIFLANVSSSSSSFELSKESFFSDVDGDAAVNPFNAAKRCSMSFNGSNS